MVRKESHDVVLPILHAESGPRTSFPIYQTKFLQLCSLVGEVMDKVSKYMSWYASSCSSFSAHAVLQVMPRFL